jgi:hypothetical protein
MGLGRVIEGLTVAGRMAPLFLFGKRCVKSQLV